ncbi:MAG: type I-C CRISPR-associated protein Cas8c/Csd1 [Actinobacteria bacterium]|nr:type I-C CRISPR-associated protein Cas8c/Csd1 [Actinomycetota bacterium]
MLEQLVKFAQEHNLVTEPGFAPKYIRWAIVIDDEGRFVNVIELGDVGSRNNRGQLFERCPEYNPSFMQGKERRSHFLAETANVVALYGKAADNPKTRDKHDYFVSLLREASTAMPELGKAAEVISDNTSLDAIRKALEEYRARETDKITFRISGVFPLESNLWHDWWRIHHLSITMEKKGTKTMVCLVTGEGVEPAMTHPKVKGLADVGGSKQGDVLIGFDKDAFKSYGLKQSENAAVSENAASAYRAALNYLIEHHSQQLAGTKIVHWFKGRVEREDDPLFWLEEGHDEQEIQAQERARELLASIRSGRRPDLQDNYYYAITLSGASGRVMVRDWMEGRFENLVENIRKWFDDLSIIRSGGDALAKSPKFFSVLGGMVRNPSDLRPPSVAKSSPLSSPLVAKLWRSAVNNEPIPRSALAYSLERMRIDIIKDEPFNHARIGLIKAYLIRQYRQGGGDEMADLIKPDLNDGYPNPAYQCGRLMAILARLQRSALGDVGAGIVQRYYAAASVTPSLVLGRLTRTSQFHLNKLDPGLAHWYEEKITEIWDGLKTGIPKTLSLEEQSLFALGYYQQIADMRKNKKETFESEKEVSDE